VGSEGSHAGEKCDDRRIRHRQAKNRRGNLIGSIALAVAAVVALAGIAYAAAPVKGARYSGSVNGTATLKVTFKVSRSGKKVTSLDVRPSLPNSCGYGGPEPTHASKPAKVKHGKFTGKITEKASNGKVIATATVTGKFLTGGKEKGTINSVLPSATSCDGNFTYSTKAIKSH
jgi:hypothetical protein